MTITNTQIELNGKVPFWRDELVADFPHTIAILAGNHSSKFFSSVTRNSAMTETDARNILTNARHGVLMQRKDNHGITRFSLLIGELKASFTMGTNNDGLKRFFPQSVYLATNTDRAMALRSGVVLSFGGIDYCTGPKLAEYERLDRAIQLGTYVDELSQLVGTSYLERVNALRGDETYVQEPELSEVQSDYIAMLESFIETEYDIDCREQQLEAPYHYQIRAAASVKHIKRQYFDFTLTEHDYKRVVEKKPTLLAIDSEHTGGDDITMEMADIEPFAEQPVIRLSPTQQAQIRDIPESGALKLMALPVLRNVRMQITEQLREQRSANPWLLPVLSGEYQHPIFTTQPVVIDSGKFPPTKSQQSAIEAGIATPDYALVLGPPGTGKTTVILEWVRYFVAQNKRVLVTSQNNKAVDNVLERLVEEPQFECLRIGAETKISSSLNEVMLDNKVNELQQRLFGGNQPLFEYLQRALDYLENLQQHSDQVQSLLAQLNEQTDALTLAKRNCHQAESKLEQAADGVRMAEHVATQAQQQRNRMDANKPTGMKRLLLGLFHWAKVRRQQRRCERTQTQQLAAGAEYKTAVIALEQAVALQQVSEQRLSDIERQLQDFELNYPGAYEAHLTLPKVRELAGIHIEELIARLDTLKQAVNNWYSKINSERERSLYPLLLEHVNVVGATCIGINTKELFRNIDFDVVIVDEAGQIQVHNLIVPLSRCDKAILVGDHKQIRPVVNDESMQELQVLHGLDDHELDFYQKSWFELLWQQAPASRRFSLDRQFRCPSEISDFVSEAFYDNNYYAGSNKLNSKPLLSFCPSPFVWLDTSMIANNHEQHKNGQFAGNNTETNIVVEVFRRALNEQPELLSEREVGIIVPYRAHVQQINKRIKTLQKHGELPQLPMPLSELVASVDSFQGQERKLIIFACSRSNKRGAVGFLSAWQRLNVAVTRAKRQLIMVGNTATMTQSRGPDAVDATFKGAMQLLVAQLQASNAVLKGFHFFPKKRTTDASVAASKSSKSATKPPMKPNSTEVAP